MFLHKSYIWILFVRYRPNALSQLDCRIFKSALSRTNQWNNLVFCMLIQIHNNWKLFKKCLVGHGQNMDMGNLVCGIWMDCVSQEWTDGMNRFFDAGTNSGKLKVDLMIFGWVWSKMAVGSWDPKICCILKMNLWIELRGLLWDFCHVQRHWTHK